MHAYVNHKWQAIKLFKSLAQTNMRIQHKAIVQGKKPLKSSWNCWINKTNETKSGWISTLFFFFSAPKKMKPRINPFITYHLKI